MKCAMLLLLSLCLLLSALPVLAEANGPAQLSEGEVLAVDLDGDGVAESLRWDMVPGEYDENLTLTVANPGGAEISYATDIIWGSAVTVLDLDGDGLTEILVSGDVMSDDYSTWCLRLTEGAFYEVLFPDGSRGDNTDGYYKQGYGRVIAAGDGRVTLSGSQDILGTWFGTRTLALTPYDRFEFDDAGLWMRDLEGLDSEALWEYGALTVAAPLSYADLWGNPAGTLEPGEKILIYASDKREVACFATRDGLNGALSISPDYERGWGWLVDGIPEEDCFEYVPYAD